MPARKGGKAGRRETPAPIEAVMTRWEDGRFEITIGPYVLTNTGLHTTREPTKAETAAVLGYIAFTRGGARRPRRRVKR
jgi:hypothetical protein